MISPDKPANEVLRMEALHRYQILDSDPERSFEDLTTIARAACGTSMAAVTLIDSQRQWFKSIQGTTAAELPRDESMCGHAILRPQEVMVIEDATRDARFHDNPIVTGEPHVRFYAGAPLLTQDGLPMGTLCVFDPQPRQLDAQQADALTALSRQVMLVMELRRFALDVRQQLLERADYEKLLADYHEVLLAQNADLAAQSRTDALTGLPNRRAMAEALDVAARHRTPAHPVGLALLDLDHFKRINDVYGHASGDRVLATVGSTLRDRLGCHGTAARYGGEEFVALFPDISPSDALQCCEMLRRAVAGLPLDPPVTISIGLAMLRDGESADQALVRADAALYRAKAKGRDRVEVD